jgi:hypothetical protein
MCGKGRVSSFVNLLHTRLQLLIRASGIGGVDQPKFSGDASVSDAVWG